MDRQCETCGGPLTGKATQRFCSARCYEKTRRVKFDPEAPRVFRRCIHCGKEFLVSRTATTKQKRPNKVYCGSYCRMRGWALANRVNKPRKDRP